MRAEGTEEFGDLGDSIREKCKALQAIIEILLATTLRDTVAGQ